MLKSVDVIAAPGEDVRETTAYRIAVQAVPEIAEKELLPVPMPMVKDRSAMDAAHRIGAAALVAELEQGKTVGFLTLGDPTVYSTFSYLERYVKAAVPVTAYVSGIPSFCAAAAALGVPLAEWQEPIRIIPAGHRLDETPDQEGTYVLMKSGRQMDRVKELLRASGKTVRMVENCGMPDEKRYASVDEIPDEAGYFSLIIAKDPETE